MTAGALCAAEENSPAASSGASSDASDSAQATPSYSSTEFSTDSSGEEQYHDGWEYDPYYIFPLTRHMPDSELPLAGQIVLYPIAFIIDLGQWPLGALAGLAGK
jgi:hypothetical protein